MPSSPPPSAPPKDAIRNASTVVLLRHDGEAPRLLMGQRGRGAAFMPSKFVFPGGAVDAGDAAIPCPKDLPEGLTRQLQIEADPQLAKPLAIAAIREVWEEAGIAIAHPADTPGRAPEEPWASFFAAGHLPAPDRLEFVFRAITPPGRPRRFDARFFMVDADGLASDLDDFSRADTELAHLSWLTLRQARKLDLPFITEVVLAEIEARLAARDRPRPVPFFHHAKGRSFIDTL